MKYTALVLLLFTNLVHAKSTEQGFFVKDADKEFLSIIKTYPTLTVDHINSKGYEVYGPKGLKTWLTTLGAPIIDIKAQQKQLLDYPTPLEIETHLKSIAKKHPDIVKLFSVGKSIFGHDLWVVKISDNVKKDEVEPEVKYIANMHGDEIVGRELMVYLIEDIANNYKTDAKIKELVDNNEIFIMPSMNPDGAERARRGNGHNIDLNRDFPDFTTGDNQNNPYKREVETQAVMKWQKSRNFALSANFHGGAVVVNYPWDTTAEPHYLEGLITDISLDYAAEVPEMVNSSEFPLGIVNGHDWYEVDGGMQDWSYHWHNDLQVTIELSEDKWPAYYLVPGYYTDNRSSLLNYLARVQQGAGIVTPKDKNGIVRVYKNLNNNKKFIGSYSYERGEFYKVLDEGDYIFEVKAKNTNKKAYVTVENKTVSNGNYKIVK